MMKYCSRCQLNKSKEDFNKSSAKKDGLQSCCRDCSKQLNNNGYIYNANRRNSIKARRATNSVYNRKLVNRYKRRYKCMICKESEPVALDLHHLDPSIKDESPSRMIHYSTEALKKEIRKCVILCSNCHRKVHAGLIVLPVSSSGLGQRPFKA